MWLHDFKCYNVINDVFLYTQPQNLNNSNEILFCGILGLRVLANFSVAKITLCLGGKIRAKLLWLRSLLLYSSPLTRWQNRLGVLKPFSTIKHQSYLSYNRANLHWKHRKAWWNGTLAIKLKWWKVPTLLRVKTFYFKFLVNGKISICLASNIDGIHSMIASIFFFFENARLETMSGLSAVMPRNRTRFDGVAACR